MSLYPAAPTRPSTFPRWAGHARCFGLIDRGPSIRRQAGRDLLGARSAGGQGDSKPALQKRGGANGNQGGAVRDPPLDAVTPRGYPAHDR